MTRKDLSDFKHLKTEIERLKREIDDLEYEYVSDTVKGSSKHFPYIQHTITITGADTEGRAQKVRRLKAKLERRKADLLDKRLEIEEFIETIDDSYIRQIIELRCIDGLDWGQVAASMGEGYTSSSIKMAYHRFIQKLKD